MYPQSHQPQSAEVNGPAPIIDSAAPKHPAAEDVPAVDASGEPPSKKTKLGDSSPANGESGDSASTRKKGVAPVKAEYAYGGPIFLVGC